MSREIKFRAWDEKRKSLWSAESIAWGCDERGYYAVSKFGHGRLNNVVLEQFTGLRDESLAEIYEGDVVACRVVAAHGRPEIPAVRGPVEITPYGPSFATYGAEHCRFVRVIGNIHENADLLEKAP